MTAIKIKQARGLEAPMAQREVLPVKNKDGGGFADTQTAAQAAVLAHLDPNAPLKKGMTIAESKAAGIDWYEEERRGNVVRTKKHLQFEPGRHVSVVNGQARTFEENVEARRTQAEMRHIYERGRLPVAGEGGIPTGRQAAFGFRRQDGSVPAFLDHAPFRGAKG